MKWMLWVAALVGSLGAAAELLPANVDLADGPGNVGTRATFLTAPATFVAGASNQSVAYGDFDRDGYDDLVLAYSSSDFSAENAGAVYVIFGRADFPATQNAATNPVAFVYCQEAGASLGAAVSAGDLDGDGRDELILGAPGYDGGRGAVAVINGAALVANGSLGLSFASTDPVGTEMRILGTEESAQFGYSLTVGNFDQDDNWDVAVGEPYADSGAKVDTGKCYVWYGDNYVTGTKINSTDLTNRWTIIGGEGDNVGTALAAGEGDNDGLDNLALGAAGYGSSARVYYMGILSPATTDYELDDVNNLDHATITGVPGLGFSLAIGETGLEGRGGLLMGAPLYGRDGMTNSGAVIELRELQAIFGSTITLNVTSPAADTLVILGANDGGLLGGSVAFSDLNGDNFLDIVIGEPGAPGADAQAQAGRIHVRYSPDPFAVIPDTLDLAVAPLDSTITGEAALGYLGASLAGGGDADGDGLPDLFVSAPFAVQGAEGLGNGYLIYGGGDAESPGGGYGVRQILAAGDTPTYGIGGRLSPTSRVKVKYVGGSESNVIVANCQTCVPTILDDESGINVATTTWVLSTDRTNVTSFTVTLNYTDADIAGMDESRVALYSAELINGPWTRVATQTQYSTRNEFTAEFTGTVPELNLALVLEAPVITLLGGSEPETFLLECGTPFVDPGATAESPVDGDITNLIVVDSSALDINTPGDYAITYNVTDSTGAMAVERIRTVTVEDNNIPSISLIGPSGLVLECGAAFTPPSYTATDACDGDLTDAVQVSGDTVDTATPGEYQILYDVVDTAGNAATQKIFPVTVDDTISPVLTLIGGTPLAWECGEPWVDPGATAFDSCAGDLTQAIQVNESQVNTLTIGVFSVSYFVDDGSSQATQAQRLVQVSDTLPPVITLVGDAEVNITCSAAAEFIDPGATAFDLCAGDVSNNIVVTGGPVDEEAPGTYTLSYNVSDGDGHSAVTVTRTVFVLDGGAPVIEVNGPLQVDVECGGTFTNEDVTVTDVCEGDITFKLQVAGTVDTSTEGTYVLTYAAVDNDNNEAVEVTRTVNVGACGAGVQTADQDGDYVITLTELLRPIQIYNSLGYHCAENPGDTEDGFVPGVGVDQTCAPYDTDYNPQDWVISLTELLRLIQFYNSLGYNYCPGQGTEDDFCPGAK